MSRVSLPSFAVALCTVAGLSSAAQADVILLTSNTAKCLQKKNAGFANGNPAQLIACANGAAENKLWSYDAASGLIRSMANTNKCLHRKDPNFNNGNPVQLWDCNAGPAEAKSWTLDAASGLIKARFNQGKCIQKKFADTNDGNPLQLFDCNANPAANKAWTLRGLSAEVTSDSEDEILASASSSDATVLMDENIELWAMPQTQQTMVFETVVSELWAEMQEIYPEYVNYETTDYGNLSCRVGDESDGFSLSDSGDFSVDILGDVYWDASASAGSRTYAISQGRGTAALSPDYAYATGEVGAKLDIGDANIDVVRFTVDSATENGEQNSQLGVEVGGVTVLSRDFEDEDSLDLEIEVYRGDTEVGLDNVAELVFSQIVSLDLGVRYGVYLGANEVVGALDPYAVAVDGIAAGVSVFGVDLTIGVDLDLARIDTPLELSLVPYSNGVGWWVEVGGKISSLAFEIKVAIDYIGEWTLFSFDGHSATLDVVNGQGCLAY